ncbi:MAG: transglycosylase domain-containing protein [Flavobacteriales bacterium]|nr:transglycosylase domain-containing protein [Flavobacteriales bacterium]
MAVKRGARKKAGKKGGGTPYLRITLIVVGVLFASFLLLMQTVRMGVFGDLPSEEQLKAIRHEEATLVLGTDGSIIGKLFAEDRTNVQYEDLPKHLIDALVATEDARFFSHQGVDGRSRSACSSAPCWVVTAAAVGKHHLAATGEEPLWTGRSRHPHRARDQDEGGPGGTTSGTRAHQERCARALLQPVPFERTPSGSRARHSATSTVPQAS